MERTAIHFMFLCFVFIASLVESNYKLYNSRSLSKNAGVQYVESTDVRGTDIDYLLKNKCKFFIVEKTIFYACPKRPTRYPALQRSNIFRNDNENKDTVGIVSHAEKFECPFPFGTYPDPKDCRKYFLCIFDKPRTMKCKSSELYDEYKNECADKSTVDCGDRTGDVTTKGTTQAPGQKTTASVQTTTKKVQKFKCPYRWGTFPNPDDCSQYYLCLNKRHQLKKCKPTELYDTEKGECEDEDEVDCGSRFNPREKTTEPATTTAATTARPTTIVTTTKEEITSDTLEQSTSPSSSGDTSDKDVTEPSTSVEVSPSSETENSEEPTQSTEQPTITDDDSSGTDETEPTSEEPEITDEGTSGTEDEPEPSSEKPVTTDEDSLDTEKPKPSSERPVITDNDTPDTGEPEPSSEEPIITDKDSSDGGESELTSEKPEITEDTSESDQPKPTSEEPEITEDTSESDQPKPTSEEPEITDDDTLDTHEPEVTSEESSEVTGITIKSTEEDNSISQEPEITDTEEPQSTESDRVEATTENDTPSKESEAPVEETTLSEEVQSSLPEDNTKSDEDKPTDGEGETDHTAEEVTTLSHQESTVKDAESSEEPLSSIESKISKGLPDTTPSVDFVCPKKKGNYPHKDCSLYYKCRGGSFETVQCPEGTLFRSDYQTCDNEEEVDCGDRKRPDIDLEETEQEEISSPPVRQVTEDSITSATSDDLAFFVCPKKKGNFAHPVDCSSYYSCRKGEVELVKCLPGLLFSEEYNTCYTDSEVDCGSRTIL